MNISVGAPAATAKPYAASYVSFHAVHRYLERILEVARGAAVRSLQKGAKPRETAVAWCADAGVSIAEVCRKIATPAVIMAIEAGVTKIRFGSFWAVVDNGQIVTFIPARRPGHLIIRTTRESKRTSKRVRAGKSRRGRKWR